MTWSWTSRPGRRIQVQSAGDWTTHSLPLECGTQDQVECVRQVVATDRGHRPKHPSHLPPRSPMTPAVQIREADPLGADATMLIVRLSAELAAMYPEYPDSGAGDFRPAVAAVAGSHFVIAWLDGRPVGCGALRPMEPGIAEVKRMYVEPDVRGRGISRQILAALECRARDMGYAIVRLETGTRQ